MEAIGRFGWVRGVGVSKRRLFGFGGGMMAWLGSALLYTCVGQWVGFSSSSLLLLSYYCCRRRELQRRRYSWLAGVGTVVGGIAYVRVWKLERSILGSGALAL